MSSKNCGEKNILNEIISFKEKDFKVVVQDRVYETIGPKFHKELEIKYCYEGSFSVRINNVVHMMKPGDIVVINPYELHENPNIVESKGRYYLIVFDFDKFYDKLAKKINHLNDTFNFKIKFSNFIQNNKEMQNLIINIVREMQEEKLYYYLVLEELIEHLIILLLREDCKEKTSEDISMEWGGEEIISSLFKIHSNYQGKISLEELAADCHMSVSNYCRQFKKIMGLSPIQYVISYRLDIAETLLQNTKMTCGEIAELCGFDDICYFIRIYKKKKGFPPTHFRKKWKYDN